MADQDSSRSDPLGDVITMLAAPIASGLRSYEQFRRGVDELFRTVDNLNTTMENLNETTARVNRLLADVEEPIRAMIPQVTRTIRAADELMDVVSGPAMRAAPNLSRLAETVASPAFVSLPNRLDEFMNAMSEVSRRLGPLTQFAESAGGFFGLRLPTSARSTEVAAITPPPHADTTVVTDGEQPAPVARAASTPPARTRTAKKAPARKTPARKAPAKKSAAKKSAAKKSAAKKSAAKKAPARTARARKAAATTTS
jgi:ABC-type transporter Mla subunit MlaD